MLRSQFRYATRSFWRTPVAAFFTLVFPVSFVVVVCAIAGNATISDRSGVRFAQFLVPVFAVFGACMAAFVSLALGVAYAREAGVLKRLRSTPLPPWVHLAGRVASAVYVSLLAFAVVTVVGVVAYDVDIVWRTLPAVVLTFVVGVACFAALGLALVSIAPTPAATQALANGCLILLAFISDVFVVQLPQWLAQVGWFFPLKHFVNAVADGFNPFLADNGPAWGHLAVMLAWGTAGALVALRFFTWEPHPSREHRSRRGAISTGAVPTRSAPAPVPVPVTLGPATDVGAPSWWRLAWGQTRFTAVKLLRDPLAVFFAIVFPVLLLVFFSAVYGREATWGGLPLPQYLAPALAVYGVAVMAYVSLPSTLADDRSRLVLKRLRGTPLPSSAYLAGRIGAAALLGAATVVAVFAVGAVLFGVRVGPAAVVVTAFAFAAVIACLTALGLLLASLIESPESVTAVALVTLLPLSMVSDIFVNSPGLPTVMSAIGWTFPLRHMAALTVAASSGQGLGTAWWGHLGVIALWGLAAAAVAWRTFRWEPRS
ncbi:ABC transporter permease [Longivirga aurantiaca]|uniref:Transport permease protein n=1 Tax=Longivirga aurantiaca TaxID=1837743 RepID=A0ABW1T1S7_9ACTN